MALNLIHLYIAPLTHIHPITTTIYGSGHKVNREFVFFLFLLCVCVCDGGFLGEHTNLTKAYCY